MIVMLLLLLVASYLTALLARAALIAWQVKRVAEGRRLWPISFATQRILAPPGDLPILALGADTWRPATTSAIAPPPRGGVRGFAIFRFGISIGRSAWSLLGGSIRHQIEGRERDDRGWLILTDKRIGWRGKRDTIDIPLADVAHMEVRRPLLELRRHSRPSQPLVVRVSRPLSVAQLVAVLSAKAMGYTVTVSPAQAGQTTGRP